MMTKHKPTVSVIIPTRNRARWLEKSIKSILSQTYLDFELIVVDDGSTDNTAKVVQSFKDKRIRYFHQRSKGAAAARNIGIKKAKGKFIAFNDDDDLWYPRKLEKQVNAFKKASQKVGVIYTGLNRIVNGLKKYVPERWVKKKEDNLHQILFLENFVDLSAAMVRRECFDKFGLFDEALVRYQDWELWLRISKHYQFRFIDQPLVDSRVLPGGITRRKKALLQASEHIFNKHLKEIKKNKRTLATWQFRLGDLYYHQGKMAKARNLLRQAFNNQPSFKYFRAIVKTILGKRISETLISFKISLVKNWKLLTILLLALLLRLINLNQSLWLDEAVQVITSQGSFSEIFQELSGDFHPPLYHLLMWLWVHLFGSSEIILRLPSVIFGVATVGVVYLLAKEFLSERLSTIVALFLATAPFHIYYSQEARNYAMATLLAAVSMFFFIKISVKKPKKNLIIGYVTTTVLLLYTNYFGLFILLVQALVVLIQRRRKQLWLMFYCLLLFIPNLILLRAQFITGRQATTSLPEWGRLVNINFLKALPLTFIKFSIGRITIFNKKIYAVVAGILFVIYGAIIARGLTGKRKQFIDHPSSIILTWLAVPILSAWLISLFIPNYQPFRLLLVLPAFYLLLAQGISQIKTATIRIIVVAFILLVNLISLSVYYINPYFHREDWRRLVQFIESQPKKEKVAILPSDTSSWPYEYYSTDKVRLISVSSGVKAITQEEINNLRAEQFKNKTVYYIRYLVPIFDPQEKTISWLNQNAFVKIKEVSFNQIPLWIYEPL